MTKKNNANPESPSAKLVAGESLLTARQVMERLNVSDAEFYRSRPRYYALGLKAVRLKERGDPKYLATSLDVMINNLPVIGQNIE